MHTDKFIGRSQCSVPRKPESDISGAIAADVIHRYQSTNGITSFFVQFLLFMYYLY